MIQQLDIPGTLIKIKDTWHYQYYEPRPDGKTGRKRRKSTGQTDYNLALEEAKRIYDQTALLKESLSDSRLLDAAVVREVRWVTTHSTEARIVRVSDCLANFAAWAGNIPIDTITTELLDEYQQYRAKCPKMVNAKQNGQWVRVPAKSGKIATQTIHMEIGYVLRMLKHNKILLERPPAPPVVQESPGRFFTHEELIKFFDACSQFPENDPGRLTPLFLLMLCTGARPCEVLPPSKKACTPEEKAQQHLPLLKSEIDYKRGIVYLRSGKRKRGQRRNVATPLEVVPVVLDMVKKMAERTPGPHVFGKFPLNNYFNRILAKAGLTKTDALGEKLTAHSFRHTYGTLQAEAGVNAFVLQNLMRHTDPRTTARYTQRALKGAVVIDPLALMTPEGHRLPPPPKEVAAD